MCSDNESPMPSHRKCKNITKVFPYNLENMIYIVSKRRKLDSIKKQYPNAIICDVTSTSPNSLVKLSPFYPHMNIPIPFWRKRSIPTHSGWLYPLTFDAGKGLKEA